jgi:hypothetical protein
MLDNNVDNHCETFLWKDFRQSIWGEPWRGFGSEWKIGEPPETSQWRADRAASGTIKSSLKQSFEGPRFSII